MPKRLFLNIILIVTLGAGATYAQVTPPFLPPPAAHFTTPQYPAPTAMQEQLISPFFRGETTWTPPMGVTSLFSSYSLPAGTRFQLAQPINYESLKAAQYYQGYITDLPPAYAAYLDSFKDEPYYVRGRDLLTQEYLADSQFRFKKPVTAFQSTPVQNQGAESTTEAGTCTSCEKNRDLETGVKKQILDAQLLAIKNKILKTAEIPQKAFLKAWQYFEDNLHKVRNQDFMTVVDYSKPSDEPRLFILNLKNGEVEKHLVAHGMNSSGKGDLAKYAVKYSNKPSSQASSPGPYITGETYNGKFGYSLRLDGQTKGVNDQARARAIVVHPWNINVSKKPPEVQDTWGCFGLAPGVSKSIIQRMKNGGLWYVEPYSG